MFLHSYNHKSDMWAVGCVLYELLTLTRVFEASVSILIKYLLRNWQINLIYKLVNTIWILYSFKQQHLIFGYHN